ncbi:MAG: hypothetical protein H6754_02020 [Candidatus Omnitrophica bacterium]|nr:hypothetical protein [Candidatus Omnitrophota bacterium]
MENKRLLYLLICLSIFVNTAHASQSPWVKRSAGILEARINCVYSASNHETFVLAGTDKAVYRADNSQSSFYPVLQNYGKSQSINQIVSSRRVPTSIYSATEAGVFESTDQGRNWKSIYSPASTLARKALCVLADEQAIYIGTADGLYVRRNNQEQWQKDLSEVGRKIVFHLADDDTYVYAATDDEVYRIQKVDQQISKIYSFANSVSDEEEDIDQEDESVRQSLVKDLIYSKKLYVVAEHDILTSQDHGETWESLPTDGLPVNFVRKLFVDQSQNIYAATEKGIFTYEDGRWQNNVQGLTSQFTNDVTADAKGNVLVATSNGIFAKSKIDDTAVAVVSYEEVLDRFTIEPTIKDVQRMAIEYANVNPRQINSWHNQSRAKALFPTLSVGLSRADTDLYHWDTGANPDVLTRGRDYLDWSTSISWDFGDFVWSSDHTSIDSRSKLMSELRQDILDQVTRLYFERRRIQVELAIEKESEPNSILEKRMRVEELTALLDGLTGGKFSELRGERNSKAIRIKGEGNG